MNCEEGDNNVQKMRGDRYFRSQKKRPFYRSAAYTFFVKNGIQAIKNVPTDNSGILALFKNLGNEINHHHSPRRHSISLTSVQLSQCANNL